MKYGAWSLPSGTAVIATGGRQVAGSANDDAHESWPWGNPEVKALIRGNRGVDGAVRYSGRDAGAADYGIAARGCLSAHGAQQLLPETSCRTGDWRRSGRLRCPAKCR